MKAIDLLLDDLSRGLNRSVGPGLANVVVKLYRDNPGKERFAEATRALGFSDTLSKSAYVYVNDNIGVLEKEIQAGVRKTKGFSDARERGSPSRFAFKRDRKDDKGQEGNTGKRKSNFGVDFFYDDESEGFSDPQFTIPDKENSLQLSLLDTIEVDLGLQKGGNREGQIYEEGKGQIDGERECHKEKGPPKKITFKKIKKADAMRLKECGGKREPPSGGVSERVSDLLMRQYCEFESMNSNLETPNVPELKKDESSSPWRVLEKGISNYKDGMNTGEDFQHFEDNLKFDREWYTLEDSTTVNVDQYADLEREYRPRVSQIKPRRDQIQHSGGHFNNMGDYVDFDHDGAQLRCRIPIIPHFIVPPFLRGSEHHLILQIDSSRTSRSAGPSVDPVKDPESELAVAARNGSFVIRDRKEKTERANQAKDRVTSKLENRDTGKSDSLNTKNLNQSIPEYTFADIQKQRRSLPAYSVRDELLKVIAENQIVVVTGETGSGKTTQIPQFLAEEGYTKSLSKEGTRLLIACTQPRRVAAMSVAKRVSEEMGVPLGEDVGYTIRFEDRTSYKKTRIKYMTEGILLRELLEDTSLEQYSCIIMDEAHERSLNTDVLLGLFRKLLRQRRDLKLIVTSATMNANRFADYFGNAPQFFIPGRTFPVEVFYSQSRCVDYVETAVKQVVTIHLANKKGDGDILVFMTGQEDIETTCELIHEKLALLDNPPPLDVFPIYSSLPADVQKKIFTKQSSDRRKVVVATNIAETSLTVDGVRYVIDCGLVKMKLFNPKVGMDALQIVPISMANAQQRSGRAGRTAPGLAYRLFTEAAASPAQMFTQPIPEIQRTNLSAVMLLLKSLHVDDVMAFPFLDTPPLDLLACSLYELWAMGALEHSGKLTPLGAKMTMFPMEPTLAKLIILSSQPEFHCAAEIITIVAMLSVPGVFYRPKERKDEADSMRERFLVAESDHLTLLNVYTQWEQRAKTENMTMAKLNAWSSRHFLHHKSLLRAKEVRTQLEAIMIKLKYPTPKARSDVEIRKCICAAYFHQSASLQKMSGDRGQAEYSNLRQSYMKMYLHPTSALVGSANLSPQYVVYDELVLTKKEYMQCVTAVEPEWLLQYGNIFYGVSTRVKRELEVNKCLKILHADELRRSMEQVEPKPATQNKTAKNITKVRVNSNF